PHEKERHIDALLVLRLDLPGPNAARPHLSSKLDGEVLDQTTLDFIHGIPPVDAVELHTIPPMAKLKVWRYQKKLYVRCPYPLVWPAWLRLAEGEDIRVYVTAQSKSLVFTKAGQYTNIMLSEEKN
ncbi:MAG: hypothetical protein IK079_05410, partial [Desulfovibrio sp.]|nr:hypothetical protein [Desulfovibrio sp.]